jgi:hypothetical protein
MLARADEVIEWSDSLLRCMSPEVARRDILHRDSNSVANEVKRKSRGS